MAGLRRRHGGLDGLQIPHLSQKDHVRGLPEAGPQGGDVAGGIHGQLPLADDALVVAVKIFDGVLDGDDVGVPAAVHRVYHAGQRGGFAAAGGTGDQHHAAGHIGDLHDLLGDIHLPPVGDAEAHDTDHRRQGASLPVGVHPEPGHAGDGQGEIIVSHGHAPVDGPVGHAVQVPDQGLRILRHQAALLQGDNLALPLDRYRFARHNKQVRGALFYRLL